jgi:hypothetical protein
MKAPDLLAGLPGEELIREGINDAIRRRPIIAACLVSIGLPRLRVLVVQPLSALVPFSLSAFQHFSVSAFDSAPRPSALSSPLPAFSSQLFSFSP